VEWQPQFSNNTSNVPQSAYRLMKNIFPHFKWNNKLTKWPESGFYCVCSLVVSKYASFFYSLNKVGIFIMFEIKINSNSTNIYRQYFHTLFSFTFISTRLVAIDIHLWNTFSLRNHPMFSASTGIFLLFLFFLNEWKMPSSVKVSGI
jgi:hypothetical protein